MDNKEKSIVEKLMDEIVPDVNDDFEFECKFLIKSINRRLGINIWFQLAII